MKNSLYIKFLIELGNLLKRYRAELYKSGIDGKQKVEFGEYAKFSDLSTNVFTLSDKNTVTYDIVNKNAKNHLLYHDISRDFISIPLYVVRTKSGDIKIYKEKPIKILGSYVGKPLNIDTTSSMFPSITHKSGLQTVIMNISTIV